MYDFVFKQSTNLQQRLTGDTVEDPTVAEAYAPDDSETTATLAAMPTPSGNGGGSFWNRLFEMLFGWIKPEREPETEVSAPEPVMTAPEPAPESEPEPVTKYPTPLEEETPQDTGSDPEPTPVTNETDPVEDDPTPVAENPAPTPDPEPVTEDPIPTPDPEPVAEEPDPTPDPEPVVEEPTEPVTDAPEPVSAARQIAPTALDSSTAVSVAGGRVTTFALPDAANITGITINTLPAHGNVTVNPDFTLALVLSGSDYAGPLSFDYTVTRSDGTVATQTATLDVATPTQAAGWGLGNHYMLETDANENIVVEHGDNHRKVYISGSEDALTRADIAALAGDDVTESMITTQWLRNNPEYGGSEGWALATDVGMDLWYDLTDGREEPSSNWLLFERGYDYDNVGQIVTRGMESESELHPVHITAYGEGARPVLNTTIWIWQEQSDNIVFSDLAVSNGAKVLDTGSNIIMSHMNFTADLNIQGSSGFTLWYSEISNATASPPLDGELWDNREQGLFSDDSYRILLEGNIFHHNGWEDDYLIDGSSGGGMPPSMFSQNVYLQYDTTDVTFRDNITSQGASYGAQIRGGGFVEGNLFLDNNVALNVLGGNYKSYGFVGNYSLVSDNVTTSAGYKEADLAIGARQWGMLNAGAETTWYNNLIAHLANPDNAAEQAWKVQGTAAVQTTESDRLPEIVGSMFYDNTIVYNWQGSVENDGSASDRRTENVIDATAMATTIQRYAAEFLNVPLSQISDGTQMSGYYQSTLITELMNYLLAERDVDGGQMFTASEIVSYFQEGFNIAAEATGATHHRFIPNDLGDGVRWDNKLNWTSDALPEDGDTVDLGGNWVNFSDTVTLASLDLGTGGKLQVGSGKLTVDALETGDNGMIFVERAGQVWTDGYGGDAALSVQVTGGRFANTGDISGPITMDVQDGQAILGADDAQFTLGLDSTLRIDGTAAKVGFDGATDGVATLMMQDGGQLSFVADTTGLGRVNEFRSGAWDQDGSNVQSGVALDGTLALDLSAYIGTGSMKLIEVDAIAGMFDNVDIHGLGDNRDATLVIDYAADLVTLELSAGTGQGSLSVIGDASDGTEEDAALWDALSSGLDQDGNLNAPITLFDDVIDPLPEMAFI